VDYRVVKRDSVQSGIHLPSLMASHPSIQLQYIQPAAQVFGTCVENNPAEDRNKN